MLLNRRKTYQKLSDEQLIIIYKRKNHTLIIGELYNRYAHLVFGVAMKYLKNKHDAEDITMIVFEKLPLRISKSNIHKFKPWMYTVTKNEIFQLFRKKGIKQTELIAEPEENNTLEEVKLKDEQLNKLESLIKTLKKEQQQCITLFYIERKSYQEIAETMQLEIKQIKSAIQNGKRNLKIKLENSEEFKSI